jgi:4-hydroxybenzoate polyprenyltransferase
MTPGKSLFSRFLTYQKERFPFVAYFFLIGSFSFSAIAYSRLCRGLSDFIEPKAFAICLLNTLSMFFLLRITDEFKDREDDARYRTYLPVPRGLITLGELRLIGMFTLMFQTIITLVFYPSMWVLLALVYGYMALMTREFFVKHWIKKRPFWYVISHMMIIPLVDVYASGYDWYLHEVQAPVGLVFFFLVSFMNGIVLEIGRKIRAPHQEEEGVLSYTYQMGTVKAVLFWMFMLTITLGLAIIASIVAGHEAYTYFALAGMFSICLFPAILFIQKKDERSAKWMEYSSIIWTFSMYLILGGIPMLLTLFR